MTDAPLAAPGGRPPRRRFGRHDRRPDPAGTFRVVVDRDVAKLLTPGFYVDGGLQPEGALRHCAFGALMSFCYVTPWIACKIPMKHWLPGGLDAVRVDRRGEFQNVPVCEGAHLLVESYIVGGRVRPADCACPTDGRCVCGMLFTTRSGKRLIAANVMDTFERVGGGIGASLPLPDLMLRFCERKLEENGEKVEARRFMGYRTVEGPLGRPLPEVPFDDLAALGRRAGKWFAPYAREGGARSAEVLERKAAVPARYPKRRYARSEPPRLPADHPLVAEMTALVAPTEERGLKLHKRWLVKEYLEKVDALVPDQMGVPQACELLLLELPKHYYAHRNYHFGSGRVQKAEYGKTRGARIKPPAPRIRPDKEQAALLDRLRRFPWSEDKVVSAGQRRELVPECFAAVDAMERARVIKMMTSRRLLRLDKVEWSLFRTAVAVGFPLERVLPEGRYPPITPEWRRRLAEEHAARAPGETDTVVYFRLRTAGWEGHVFTVRGICEELRRAPPVPAEEPALVAMLRGYDWPADEAEVRKESERLLADHVAEAAALVADGRAEGQALQALFRTYRDRFSFLLAALRAGLSVDQAMRPKDGRPVGPEGWEVAAAVTAAAGYGETVRTLYFRAVLAGFEGSEAQFRAGAGRMRQVRAEG
jgi:hypothetical protein